MCCPIRQRELDVRAPVDAALLAEIERAVAEHGLLADVVRWAGRRSPPCELVAVIEQDEYTLDLVLRWPLADGGAVHLVYDST